MRTIYYLAAIAGLLLFAGCAGMSAAEVGGTVAAGTAAAVTWGEKFAEFVGLITPLLPPDMQVAVAETAGQASTLAESMSNGFQALAGVVKNIAGSTEANAAAAAAAAERAAEGITLGEAGIIGGSSVAADRALSYAQRQRRAAKAANGTAPAK